MLAHEEKKMDVKYLKQVLLGFLSVLLVLAILGYVVYHITNGFSSEIETTPALAADYYEYDTSVGYIFRYEKETPSRYHGTANYNVANGEKVQKNSLVATVYENESDEVLTAEMISIDKKIELLSRSNISDNLSVSDTYSTDEEISQYLLDIIAAKREGKYPLASNSAEKLLVALNRRELIVSTRTSFDSEIALLRARRAELASRLGGESEGVFVDESGYFYYECDGYENIFLPQLLEDMTVSEFNELVSTPASDTRAVGKNVTSQNWSLALKLDSTLVAKYRIGEKYVVSFEDYNDLDIEMKLKSVSTEGRESLLVFECGNMPAGFSFERTQSVSVITGVRRGLRIPASAVRIHDGVNGVFVLYGNTVFFRVVEVFGNENGYAYVSAETAECTVVDTDSAEQSSTTYYGLSLYDEVIISGVGFYHTMIVN